MSLIEHRDFDALCAALAPKIAEVVRAGLAGRGCASLALAGGSTPLPLYHRLAQAELDWPRVTLLPGDERWVSEDHDASNLRSIREAFDGVPARFGALVPTDPGPLPSLDVARATLDRIQRPFDVCVLGMGSDGHFASLFPGAPELRSALDPDDDEPLAVIRPDPMPEDAPYPRVSLTLSAVATSRYPLLVLRGARKREVLEAARGGDPRRYPVAALLDCNKASLEIHWSP